MQATLIKRKTDDGLLEMQDHIPLGTTYEIDLATIMDQNGYNFVLEVIWNREMVMADNGEWLPTELLNWEGKQ